MGCSVVESGKKHPAAVAAAAAAAAEQKMYLEHYRAVDSSLGWDAGYYSSLYYLVGCYLQRWTTVDLVWKAADYYVA